MLSSFHRAFFSCAIVAGGMRVEVTSTAEELLRSEVDDMIVKVQRAGLTASSDDSVPDTGTITLLMLTRECVQEQAENYPSLMAKYNYPVNNPEDLEENGLLNDVMAFWAIRDLRRNHLSSYNVVTGAIASMRDSTVLAFTEQLQNISNRFDEVGFNYAGAESRCAEDGASQARTCIVERATAFAAGSSSGIPALAAIRQKIPNLVTTRLEMRDLQVHSPVNFETSELNILTETIAGIGFDLPSVERECTAMVQQRAEEVVQFLKDQLQSPAPSIDDCNENADLTFCPEGTALTVSRPSETVRGTAAFSATYFAAWPVLNFVAPVLTTLMGFGPGLGFLFANGPLPHGAIFGSIAYALFSTGARTCMCFPQECSFDNSTSTCSLGLGASMAPSNNPFSHAVPFMSSKCVPSPHREGACEMQACGETDFTPTLGDFNGAPLFGTLGQHNGGLYNCLSDSGSSADTLLIKTELPGTGLPNTPENRNAILEQFLSA